MAVEDVHGPLEACADDLEVFAEANREGEENIAAAMGHLTVAVTALSVAQEELAAAGLNLHDGWLKFGYGYTRTQAAARSLAKVDTRASSNPTIRVLPAYVLPLEKVSRRTMMGIMQVQQSAEGAAGRVQEMLDAAQQLTGEVKTQQAPLIPRLEEAGEWAAKIREYLDGV